MKDSNSASLKLVKELLLMFLQAAKFWVLIWLLEQALHSLDVGSWSRSQPGKVKVKAMFVYVYNYSFPCNIGAQRMAVEKSMMFRDAPGVVYSIKLVCYYD